jgi:hypothetical protein
MLLVHAFVDARRACCQHGRCIDVIGIDDDDAGFARSNEMTDRMRESFAQAS